MKLAKFVTNNFKKKFSYTSQQQTLCEKYPNAEFFLVRIFPYLDRIRENTEPEKTPYLDTFHAVKNKNCILKS